jgi:hypothetical protein
VKTYTFIREDNGQSVEVDFETMMQQDTAGFIRLPAGCGRMVAARRASTGSFRRAAVQEKETGTKPIPPSDALGFTVHQLAEFEADRVAHGFHGVEFVQDPMEPTFRQVKCSSRREWERYVEHRGFYDKNRTSAVAISADDLERAREMVSRAKS